MGRLLSWPARLPVLATTLFAALLTLSAVAAAQPDTTWSNQEEDTTVHDDKSVNPLAQEDAHITDHMQFTPSPTRESAIRELYSYYTTPPLINMHHRRPRRNRRPCRRPPRSMLPKKSRPPPKKIRPPPKKSRCPPKSPRRPTLRYPPPATLASPPPASSYPPPAILASPPPLSYPPPRIRSSPPPLSYPPPPTIVSRPPPKTFRPPPKKSSRPPKSPRRPTLRYPPPATLTSPPPPTIVSRPPPKTFRPPPKKSRRPPKSPRRPTLQYPPPATLASPPPLSHPPPKIRSSPPPLSYPPPATLARPPPMRYPPPSTPLGTWPGFSGDLNGGYGRATYYDGGEDGGACGTGPDVPVYFAALSSALYYKSAACGACFELQCMGVNSGRNTCTSNKIVVRATDYCPDESPVCVQGPHFDLSPPAFAQLGDLHSGLLQIKYTRVPCPRAPTNATKVRVLGAHRWYLSVSFPDANERVMAVQLQMGRDPEWKAFSDSWGQTFVTGGFDMEGKIITLRLTGESGRSILLTDCLLPGDRTGNKVKSCAGNFPPPISPFD